MTPSQDGDGGPKDENGAIWFGKFAPCKKIDILQLCAYVDDADAGDDGLFPMCSLLQCNWPGRGKK